MVCNKKSHIKQYERNHFSHMKELEVSYKIFAIGAVMKTYLHHAYLSNSTYD